MTARIRITEDIFVPASAIRIAAVRASGPGGQNVNKVSTKVDLRVDLAAIIGMDEAARARLVTLAESRLDAEGRLQVVSQKTRDQARNIEDAYEKVRVLVLAALVVPRARRATRPSRGAVRRRLEDKKRVSDRKRARGPRSED